MIIKCPVDKNILDYLKKISIESDIEICGFIKSNDGLYNEFEKQENMHPDPKNYFIISPRSMIKNEDSILFHSHPPHALEKGFSDWDLENQEYYYLDMLVYSVNNDEFYYKKV
jgi:hypothetical protein